jgi:aspartyl-tRNA(Asn)/glutamyl-tRNA(Gln) amidotransferase subunit A
MPPPLRLGILPHDYKNAPEAKKAFEEAQEVFRKAKCVLKPANYPQGIPYDEAASLIVTAEGAAAFENLIRSPKLMELADPAQHTGFLAGLSISAVDYLRALRIRTLASEALATLWKDYDALIAPTLLQVATPLQGTLEEHWKDMGGNGGPGNLAGLPSISIPMGFGKAGCPLGLEIIAAPFQEQRILSLAILFQQATNWHRLHPLL